MAARALTDEREWRARKRSRENAYYEWYFFDWGHLQHKRAKPDVEHKYMNSDKAQP